MYVRWYQNYRWIAAMAGFVAACAFAAFSAVTVVNSTTIDDLSKIAEANAHAIDGIERNQAGIDELVAFVAEIRARTGPSGTERIIQMLCESSDPVRQEACHRLQSSAEVP